MYYLQSRYYDPEVGRFLNADAYTSTGQGILGNNMFAYCLNNPVIYMDSLGTDAILILEEDSAAPFGHAGLLVQDSEGNWYYFYWGPTDPEAFFLCMFFYTDEICVFIDLEVKGSDIKTAEDIREALQNHKNATDPRVGEQADDITDIIYLEGDYVATYEHLSQLSSEENLNDMWVQYSLFFNNCSQQSLRALSASNPAFLSVNALIPVCAYYQVCLIEVERKIYKNYQSKVMP